MLRRPAVGIHAERSVKRAVAETLTRRGGCRSLRSQRSQGAYRAKRVSAEGPKRSFLNERMDPTAEKRAIHCALWLQSCARTHKLWCDCPVWTTHIKGWRPTEGDTDPGTVVGDVGDGEEIRIDAFGGLVDADTKSVTG